MSKPRFMATLEIDTEAHALKVLSGINSTISGKNIFELHNVKKFVDEDNKNIVSLDIRFNSEIDRDTIKDFVIGRVKTHPVVKKWVLSMDANIHNCTHNDINVKPCTQTQFIRFVK